MGIASTHSVLRKDAKDAIRELLHGKKLSNTQLEDMLEIAVNNEFYNFWVVDDLTADREPNINSSEGLINITKKDKN